MKKEKKLNKWKWIADAAVLVSAVYIAYINVKRKVMLEDNSVDIEDDDIEETYFPNPKNILITGANSYIGSSVENWLKKANEKYGKQIYEVTVLDMLDESWKKHDFAQYDVVYHVAGIAHADVGNVTREQKKLYYKINTNLTVEVAEKAKESGVKQFIFMSSMIVYSGCKERIITKDTKPKPLNFYGDSKWLADQKMQNLQSDCFKVVILRPPMIYGKGSKGNYPQLAKLAGKIPVFPIIENKRSMLYIDNLCQFVKLMIDNEEHGIFFPQNGEYSNTSDMVQIIAKVKGHPIIMVPGLEWAVRLLGGMHGKIGRMADKVFGSLVYEMEMSEYKKNYRMYNLKKSLWCTEGEAF